MNTTIKPPIERVFGALLDAFQIQGAQGVVAGYKREARESAARLYRPHQREKAQTALRSLEALERELEAVNVDKLASLLCQAGTLAGSFIAPAEIDRIEASYPRQRAPQPVAPAEPIVNAASRFRTLAKKVG